MPVVSVHAAQSAAKMALDGEYSKARQLSMMYQRLLYRNARSVAQLLSKSFSMIGLSQRSNFDHLSIISVVGS